MLYMIFNTLEIFPDLSKVFNTIDHDILLHKSPHYGIRGIRVSLERGFKSYLSNSNRMCPLAGPIHLNPKQWRPSKVNSRSIALYYLLFDITELFKSRTYFIYGSSYF